MRPATALSSVFRRIGQEEAAPAAPVMPRAVPRPAMPMPSARLVPRPRGRAATPQLLGFAEPVANVPPIEDFLPAEAPKPDPEPVAITALEAQPTPPLEPTLPEPPVPEPVIPGPPIQETAIQTVSAAEPLAAEPLAAEPLAAEPLAAEPPATEPPAEEPQRTIRARVRDLPPPETAPAEIAPERPQSFVGRLGRRHGDASSTSSPIAAPRFEQVPSASAPEARRLAETARPVTPAPKLTTPPPAQMAERGGRPSLPRNRRLYRRATLPADIEIDGVPCTLIDVSIGGFAATGVPAQLQPNALVPVMIRLVIDGIEVGTQLKARIVYVTQSRSAGRFVDLTPSQMAFLRYIVTWRGESVGAVGTTTLLDAIAGGDRGFAPGATGRSEFEPKSRWWAGLIGKKINPPR